jgi:hypothetical protein
MPTIQPLQIPEYSAAAPSAFDFAPLAQMIQQRQQQQQQPQGLAALAPQDQSGMPAPMARQAAVPYAASGAGGYGGGAVGGNVQSWYDFARKPLDQGGLGLTHEQAAGKVANLQAESGSKIPSWGPTGDNNTAWGAAQWRGDRLTGLQKFAADRGLDYRGTEAQQGFMRQEYMGPERGAYERLISAKTPQEAASVVNRFYERSADRSGRRESYAERLARTIGGN